jgi:hypothetical protein
MWVKGVGGGRKKGLGREEMHVGGEGATREGGGGTTFIDWWYCFLCLFDAPEETGVS